jgi:hypothetical protein
MATRRPLIDFVMVALFGALCGVLATMALIDSALFVERHDATRTLEISRALAGDWRICDGPDGACFPLANLREATEAIHRQGRP